MPASDSPKTFASRKLQTAMALDKKRRTDESAEADEAARTEQEWIFDQLYKTLARRQAKMPKNLFVLFSGITDYRVLKAILGLALGMQLADIDAGREPDHRFRRGVIEIVDLLRKIIDTERAVPADQILPSEVKITFETPSDFDAELSVVPPED